MNSVNNMIKLILGIILLLPALISVLGFLIQLLTEANILKNFVDDAGIWTGSLDYDSDGGGGGYMSALPVYLGLMAISGAVIIASIKEETSKF